MKPPQHTGLEQELDAVVDCGTAHVVGIGLELEGKEGEEHIAEYADGTTERGKCLLRSICEDMGFDSLSFQSLDGMLDAIGIDRKKICTYCWNGEE